jgi:hypothetical protein
MNREQIAQEGVCPVCGSTDIEYHVPDVEIPSYVTQVCVCNKCGASFNEYYDLDFYGQGEVCPDQEDYNGREDVMADGKIEAVLEGKAIEQIEDKLFEVPITLEFCGDHEIVIGAEGSTGASYRFNTFDEIGKLVKQYLIDYFVEYNEMK